MSTSYIFDTATEEGRQHVQLLEGMFDHVTTHLLGRCDLRQGHRCLDIGAGGGSVTAWLAEETGDVVATDIDTDHLVPRRGVTVRRHDINDGLPESGRYDLIHARAVLQHLQRREEIFRDLVGALLRMGGWFWERLQPPFPRSCPRRARPMRSCSGTCSTCRLRSCPPSADSTTSGRIW